MEEIKEVRCKLIAGDMAYRYIWVQQPAPSEIRTSVLQPVCVVLDDTDLSRKPTLVMRKAAQRVYQFLKVDGTVRVYLEVRNENEIG